MFNYRKNEKGQAIILIALAILGLLAFTALAIDTGNSFADRRHAQLAADNAALAGALAKANPPENVTHDAYLITSRNGYTNDADHQVDVMDGVYGGPFRDCKGNIIDPVNHADPDDNISQYVQVTIHSSVVTYFGQVIGIYKMYNCVYSIARQEPSQVKTLFRGQQMAAVNCEAKDAMDTTGSSKVYLIGGGMFSNSAHEESLLIHSPGNLETLSVTAVGGIKANGWNETDLLDFQTHESIPCPFPDYMLPKYSCTYTYNVDFPPRDGDDNVDIVFDPVTNTNKYVISPGTYCLNAKFNNPNMEGEDVTFVMLNEGIYWESNTTGFSLKATDDSASPVNHILIYMPPENTHAIVMNGGFNLTMEGIVLAPGANITLNGTFDDASFKTQWIGNTIKMAGDLNATFVYDDALARDYVQPPLISLWR